MMVNRKKICLVGGLVAAMTLSAHGLSIKPTTLPHWTENEKSKFAAGEQSASLKTEGVMVSLAPDRPNHRASERGKGHFDNAHFWNGNFWNNFWNERSRGWRYVGPRTSGNETYGNGTTGNGVSVPDAGGTLALLGLAIGSLALVRRKWSV